VGVFKLGRVSQKELYAGSVGYMISGIKTVSDTRIGDTITLDLRPAPEPLPGFKEAKPVVFSSIYPIYADDYLSLAEALEKYKLNDASLVYQKDSSAALGQGFRSLSKGFLSRSRPGLSLRLPGAFAPGNRGPALGKRIRPGYHHDRAQRQVPPGSPGPSQR